MSVQDLTRVVERVGTDFAFMSHLTEQPEAALAEYDLSAEERAAVLQGDPTRLDALGVDPRITKGWTQ